MAVDMLNKILTATVKTKSYQRIYYSRGEARAGLILQALPVQCQGPFPRWRPGPRGLVDRL